MNCFNPALGPAFVQWVAISIAALSSFYVPPASSKYSSPHWDISNNCDVLRDLIWAGDRTELATEYLKSSRPSDLVTPFQVLEIVSSGLVDEIHWVESLRRIRGASERWELDVAEGEEWSTEIVMKKGLGFFGPGDRLGFRGSSWFKIAFGIPYLFYWYFGFPHFNLIFIFS